MDKELRNVAIAFLTKEKGYSFLDADACIRKEHIQITKDKNFDEYYKRIFKELYPNDPILEKLLMYPHVLGDILENEENVRYVYEYHYKCNDYVIRLL